MTGRFVLVLTLTAGFLTGCETTRPRTDAVEKYQGVTFEAARLPAVTIANEQGDGYAVHYFRVGKSSCQMGIYEGQRPRLFSKKEKNLTVMRRGTVSRPGIGRGDDLWGVDSNSLLWRESVWEGERVVRNEKGKTYRLPTMLHIWYFGANEEEAEVFDSIVDTIEMRK